MSVIWNDFELTVISPLYNSNNNKFIFMYTCIDAIGYKLILYHTRSGEVSPVQGGIFQIATYRLSLKKYYRFALNFIYVNT